MKPKLVTAGNMDAFNKKFPHEYAYKAYPISKGKPKKMKGKQVKKKSAISLLTERMDKTDNTLNRLGTTVDKLGERMDKMDYTLNQIGDAVMQLVTEVKQINTRLDGVEARLDYNNLKKLPDNYKING